MFYSTEYNTISCMKILPVQISTSLNSNQIGKHAKPVEQRSKDDLLTECKLLRLCAEKGAAQNIKTGQLVCIQTGTWIICPVL